MFMRALDYGLQNQYLQKIFLFQYLYLFSNLLLFFLSLYFYYYEFSIQFRQFIICQLVCQNLILMIILDTLITFMPLVGLYSQYSLIKQRKHIGSFSIDICGILIFSNILRIMFWFSKGFAINLLIQSFLVIGMSVIISIIKFALLSLCVQIGYKKNNSLTDLTGKQEEGFWRWKSIAPFIIFTIFFTVFISLVTCVFIYLNVAIYGEVIGFMAICFECFLGFPQIYSNQKSKSVEGLSIFMIGTWFFGDFFKTLYFIVMNLPTQFIIGGAVQLSIDLMIVIQIMAFRQKYQTLPQAKEISQFRDQIHQQIPKTNQFQIYSEDGI